MRIFIAVLVLIFSFQSWTKADDISDFEIEGISLGDSLLDYVTKEEIKISEGNSSIMKDRNGTDRYIIIFIDSIPKEEYEHVQITYKVDDEKYIIQSIDGIINFPKNFEECKRKMNVVVDDLKKIFIGLKIKNTKGKHTADKSGKSIYSSTYFDLPSGEVNIWCTEWSDEVNYDDGLAVTLRSSEYTYFLENENKY